MRCFTRFENIINLKPEEFHRLTRVKLETFKKMVEIIDEALREKKSKGGRPNKLCNADMILMTLEYLREYRSYFHISTNYGVSESNCYYNIRFVEDTLIKCGHFALKYKLILRANQMAFQELKKLLEKSYACVR